MYYQQDISHAQSTLPNAVWQEHKSKADEALKRLQATYAKGDTPLLQLPEDDAGLAVIKQHAADILSSGCKHLVLVGTGGSSLGAQTLSTLSKHATSHTIPTLHVLDNTDPATARMLYETLDAKSTMFLLISKSGRTVEVLSHALIGMKYMREQLGEAALKDHFLVITQPEPSPLQALADAYQLKTLDHDPNVGGRYSVLSLVGLLPAACLGVDVEAVREGAKSVLREMLAATTAEQSAPALGAALQVAQLAEGRGTHVLMPYCDQLHRFGRWYQQLVAESLGKDGKGVLPFTAQGAVHQHSLLQLFLDGPDTNWFTLISLDHKGRGPHIPTTMAKKADVEYLTNHAIGDVIFSQQIGTGETLKRHGRPLREIKLGASLSAETLGALLMHWMLETIISADIMQVNPFDQPAVEEGKKLARAQLEQ